MERAVIIKKKITWHDYRALGFTPLELRFRAAWWIQFCRRFGRLDIYCYRDYAVVYLTERSGQMLYPVYIAYSKITAEPCQNALALVVPHPIAGIIYTALKPCHFVQGSPDDLLDLIAQGTTQNDEIAAYAMTMEHYGQ